MSNTLIHTVNNQSNGVGKNTSTSGTGNGAPFYQAQAGIRYLAWSGALLPGSWAARASEPIADPTNAIDGSHHATRATADPLSSLGNSPMLMFADALKTGGRTENQVVINNCLASTYVAVDWNDSGGYETQESRNTLLGTAKCRANAMMRYAPNPKLGAWICCLGESECADASNATATALQASVAAELDSVNAWATRRSWTWDKNHHFIIPQICLGYASAPLNWPWVTLVRSALVSLAAARTDVLLVTDPFAGGYIHLDKNDQQARASAMAAAYLATT